MISLRAKAEYVDSTWVYYEWDMYINAMLKGSKKGQIVTILKDLKYEEINMDLWKYESFDYADYKDRILSYIETPSYIERREEESRMSSWKLAKKESFWSYLNPFRHWGMYASILYGIGIWVILELAARV